MRIFGRIVAYSHFLMELLFTNIRLIIGMWKLTRIPQPAVTIFGSARVNQESNLAQKTTLIANKLAHEGFSIITGGGPGIMEAANRGVYDYLETCSLDEQGKNLCNNVKSAGISVVRLNLERRNGFVHEQIVLEHFFARKWLLVRYSVAFIVFPGGFGTLDELFEIITLRQTDHMQAAPIILIDSEFWNPLIEWSKKHALPKGFVSQQDIDLLVVVDNVDQAIDIIKIG